MRYPNYPAQPYTGDLPTMYQVGPSDARYTSMTAPFYQAPFDRRYGRRLAGTDVEVTDESADPGWASNELEALAEQDDIQNSGIFDPPGTHSNIHPDAGVFAARYSLPGYHAREIPFAKSEVVDATTGRRVVGVPSGAVSLDSAAQIAFIEQGAYKTPRNVVQWQGASRMPEVSITDWMQDPQTIGPSGYNNGSPNRMLPAAPVSDAIAGLGRLRAMRGFGDDPSLNLPSPSTTTTSPNTKLALTVIGIGLAGGALFALFHAKGKKK